MGAKYNREASGQRGWGGEVGLCCLHPIPPTPELVLQAVPEGWACGTGCPQVGAGPQVPKSPEELQLLSRSMVGSGNSGFFKDSGTPSEYVGGDWEFF